MFFNIRILCMLSFYYSSYLKILHIFTPAKSSYICYYLFLNHLNWPKRGRKVVPQLYRYFLQLIFLKKNLCWSKTGSFIKWLTSVSVQTLEEPGAIFVLIFGFCSVKQTNLEVAPPPPLPPRGEKIFHRM